MVCVEAEIEKCAYRTGKIAIPKVTYYERRYIFCSRRRLRADTAPGPQKSNRKEAQDGNMDE